MGDTYIAIDLKSFYASVECVARGLDPMTTNLVVADKSRTEKTICLAVSPALKLIGLPGRPRLFEVVQQVKYINNQRRYRAPGGKFTGSSYDYLELNKNPALSLDYIVAPPQMAKYMDISSQIYGIYLKYIAAEDIHVYSIDEVFMDVTHYLATYKMSAHDLAMTIIRDVLKTTGITATAGIGTNLYLCKVAMDIVAKKMPADQDGVRIAELNEMSYRQQLWDHRPITDFWRVGRGYAKRLQSRGLYTMGDVARASLSDVGENLLYKLLGVNAELLIDHAWGWESCTMGDIKAYRPASNSVSSSQVLSEPYTAKKAKIIVQEMADAMALDLAGKGLVTDQIALTVGYDVDNLTSSQISDRYQGEVATDHYGRKIPKHAHGSISFERPTSSAQQIVEAASSVYDRIVNKDLLVRRLSISAGHLINENAREDGVPVRQLNLFTDYKALVQQQEREASRAERECRLQQAAIAIRKKYGKNAMLKGLNLQDGATARERNNQIGGHKA